MVTRRTSRDTNFNLAFNKHFLIFFRNMVQKFLIQKLEHWTKKLNLTSYKIKLRKVSALQVADEFYKVGNHLVGVVTNHKKKKATIYYTKKLGEEDILHELLHIKYPSWPEDKVREETRRLSPDFYVGDFNDILSPSDRKDF